MRIRIIVFKLHALGCEQYCLAIIVYYYVHLMTSSVHTTVCVCVHSYGWCSKEDGRLLKLFVDVINKENDLVLPVAEQHVSIFSS